MEKLFTYGSLQIPEVQLRVFGRLAKGVPDSLEGFRKFDVDFGTAVYPMIEPDSASRVEGQIIEVTKEELALIDRYETDAYRRIQVTLNSGVEAWVYCKS
jgi:gamma-glutamylcyclotransferase (GGCT)/AIG2-like uncharacterized protein YtfP